MNESRVNFRGEGWGATFSKIFLKPVISFLGSFSPSVTSGKSPENTKWPECEQGARTWVRDPAFCSKALKVRSGRLLRTEAAHLLFPRRYKRLCPRDPGRKKTRPVYHRWRSSRQWSIARHRGPVSSPQPAVFATRSTCTTFSNAIAVCRVHSLGQAF